MLIAGLRPPVLWDGGLIPLGSAVYFFSMRIAALELKRFVGLNDGSRRLSCLVWIAYAIGGSFCMLYRCIEPNYGTQSRNWIRCSIIIRQCFGYVLASGYAARDDVERNLANYLPSLERRVGVAAVVVIVSFVLFVGPGLE